MQEQAIFHLTGTPFVDAGIAALCVLSGKKTPEKLTFDDLVSSSEKLTEIYLSEKWGKTLYSIFPNSILTNPSSRKKGNIRQKYLDFLKELVSSIGIDEKVENVCVSCGSYHVRKPRMRMDIPLLGSGDMLNFFPSAQIGADYCSACTLAVQFFPLTIRKGADLYCIHSASPSILRGWADQPMKMLRKDLALGEFGGPLSAISNFPKNSLFEFTSEILEEMEEDDYLDEKSGTSVDMLQFSNFQQGANLKIFPLPTRFFRFLFDLQHDQVNLADWKVIVSRHYKRKKNSNEVDYNRPNSLYQAFLDGRSLVSFFIDRKATENLCRWELVNFYLERIEKMEKERIDKIRQIADNIGEYLVNGNHLRTFHNFENCKTYPEFRNQMRKIQKDWVLSKHNGVPFSFDDYVDYLFPESIMDWREIRDLMLFRIYDKLSSTNMKEQILEIKTDEELMEEE